MLYTRRFYRRTRVCRTWRPGTLRAGLWPTGVGGRLEPTRPVGVGEGGDRTSGGAEEGDGSQGLLEEEGGGA